MFTSLLTTAAALLLSTSVTVHAQGDLSSTNNVTSLQGTWSSGSGAVETGGVSVVDLVSFVCLSIAMYGLGVEGDRDGGIRGKGHSRHSSFGIWRRCCGRMMRMMLE